MSRHRRPARDICASAAKNSFRPTKLLLVALWPIGPVCHAPYCRQTDVQQTACRRKLGAAGQSHATTLCSAAIKQNGRRIDDLSSRASRDRNPLRPFCYCALDGGRAPGPRDAPSGVASRSPYTAASSLSPVRMRITLCRSLMKIFPSPTWPVRAEARIASTTV